MRFSIFKWFPGHRLHMSRGLLNNIYKDSRVPLLDFCPWMLPGGWLEITVISPSKALQICGSFIPSEAGRDYLTSFQTTLEIRNLLILNGMSQLFATVGTVSS